MNQIPTIIAGFSTFALAGVFQRIGVESTSAIIGAVTLGICIGFVALLPAIEPMDKERR